MMQIGFVPFEHLFPRVVAVVHHGGAGTSALACRAGVPSLAVPHFGDHFYWAHALVRRGVAPPAIRRERLTARRLAAAIRRVLDEARFADAARGIASLMRSEDGASDAASRSAC